MRDGVICSVVIGIVSGGIGFDQSNAVPLVIELTMKPRAAGHLGPDG